MSLSARKRLAFRLAVVLAALGVIEGAAALALRFRLPTHARVRSALLGEEGSVVRDQRSIGQPYLLYTPAPGVHGHNEGGYRGDPVAVRRREGVARVLCMGGSTTYGWKVEDGEETYPAALQRILDGLRPPGVEGVEVINAGIPYGTSAELLTHYHFKYHYFRPDVVVLNTGGNDAAALIRRFYQPDYSHWRRPMLNPEPLPPPGRWLLRSRALSLAIVQLFRSEFLSDAYLIRGDRPPPTRWYPDVDRGEAGARRPIPRDDVAFRHNLRSLVEEIRRDGAQVVLLAFRERPDNDYRKGRLREIERSRRLMAETGREYGIPYLPFPAAVIAPEHWADRRCHLDAVGSAQKAAYVAPTVAELLWPGASGASPATDPRAASGAAPQTAATTVPERDAS